MAAICRHERGGPVGRPDLSRQLKRDDPGGDGRDHDGRDEDRGPAARHDALLEPIGQTDEPPEHDESEEVPGCLAVEAPPRRQDEQAVGEDEECQAVGRQIDGGLALVAGNERVRGSSPSIQKSSATGTPSAAASRNASSADGVYWPVSMELIV